MLIVFPHIERTAGSTIHAWFYHQQCSNFFYIIHVGGGETIDHIYNSKEKGTVDSHGYIGGHFTIQDFITSELNKTNHNRYIFSVCRHPIDRFVSMYKLWRRSPDWMPGIRDEPNKKLDSFYHEIRENFFKNRTCRYLSQDGTFKSVLHETKVNKIEFIGLTSRLDLIANKLFGDMVPFLPDFHPQPALMTNAGANISENELVELGLNSELKDLILYDNYEDNLLHEYIIDRGALWECNID